MVIYNVNVINTSPYFRYIQTSTAYIGPSKPFVQAVCVHVPDAWHFPEAKSFHKNFVILMVANVQK